MDKLSAEEKPQPHIAMFLFHCYILQKKLAVLLRKSCNSLFCVHTLFELCIFKEHILPKPRAYYRVDQSAEPDVWVDAVQVWEVKCADLSLSPVYKAAMGLVSRFTFYYNLSVVLSM